MSWLSNAANKARAMLAREERGDLHKQPVQLIRGMPSAPEPCALAKGHWTPEKHPSRAIGQYKVNGIRCLYIQGVMISRNALPLDCALHCMPGLQRLERDMGRAMVFDGEYFSDSLENTLAEQKRGEGVGTFWMFDMVPYSEWQANRFTQKLHQRMGLMREYFPHNEPFLGLLEPWEMNADKVIEVADTVWGQGHEGLVIKDYHSLYHRGRTDTWLKVKKTHNAIGEITDCIIKDGRLVTMIVKVNDRAQRISAMPPAIKDAIWRSETKWMGRKVEVQWNDETTTGRLQGARILRGVPRENAHV